MYMPDMSSYAYVVDAPLTSVKAIGWLDDKNDYTHGSISPQVLEKLVGIYKNYAIRNMCGHHICPFCSGNPVRERFDDAEIALGSSEIWIPLQTHGFFFAAPDLILHYCKAHNYLPPKEFLDAVFAFDLQKFSRSILLDNLSGFPERLYNRVEFELAMPMSEEEMIALHLRQRERKKL